MVWILAVAALLFAAFEVYVNRAAPGTIAAFAKNAGFSGVDLDIAVAIAIAESSGNPDAVGDENLAPEAGPSYGLWQINIGTNAHPEYANANLFDPQTNANAAFAIYQQAGNSFRPWTTFLTGAYQKYLSQNASTDSEVSADVSAGDIGTLDTSTDQEEA